MKRPTRRRRKSRKEGVAVVSPFSIARSVYRSITRDINQMRDTVYNEQALKTGSPNFFYRGETYIIKNSLPVHPLDNELRSDMDIYLDAIAVNEKIVKTFKFAISRLISSGVTYSDLYYVFPESGHQFLEGIEQVQREPEYIKDILSKDIGEIQALVQEQALYELIE